MSRRRVLSSLLVLGAGAALPLARVLPRMGTALPGSEFGDVYKHAWSYWHTLHVLGAGTWPGTDALNATGGGVLLDVMLLPALALAPVTAVAGPVVAANLGVLLLLWSVGVASWALARFVTGSEIGAVAAGLLAQASPFLIGYPLASGVHERLLVGVFPLVVLGMLRLRERPSLAWTVGLASATGAVALACPSYGFFTAALVVMGLPVWLGPRQGLAGRSRRLLPAALGMAVGLAAAAYVALRLTDHPGSLAPQAARHAFLGLGLQLDAAPALPSFAGRLDRFLVVATPGDLLSPWRVRASRPMVADDELHWISYLGFVILSAAVAGATLARGPRRWAVRSTTALGFAFALLALGPSPRPGLVDPLFLVLAWVIPGYGTNPPAWQQAGVFAPLAAVGIAALVGRAGRWGPAAAGGLVTLALLERALVVPIPFLLPPAPAEVSAVVRMADGEGALVDIPRAWRGAARMHGRAFLAQTVHGHPTAAAINLGASAWDAWLPLLHGRARDWGGALDCLRRAGFRWLVVHRDAFADPGAARAMEAEVRARAGAARADDGTFALYDLGGIPPAGPSSPSGPPLGVSPLALSQAGLFGPAPDSAFDVCPLDAAPPLGSAP